MSRFLALSVVVTLVVGGIAFAEDKKDVPKDLAPFQGTWKVVKAELNGKVVGPPKLQFTFSGESAKYLQGEETGPGSIVVDAKQTPTAIDLISEVGKKSLGIYKFEDDGAKLILCFVKGGDKRPTKFDSTDLKDAVLLTLEKVKK